MSAVATRKIAMQKILDPDSRFMAIAMEEARCAFEEGEVPVGAVVAAGNRLLARAHNQTQRLNDVTAHAEMLAITAAAESLGGKYLNDCTLYVTLEPCIMCAGAIGWSQLGRLVYGASDEKRGYHLYSAGRSPLHPRTEIVQGVMAEEAAQLMRDFFAGRRRSNKS